MKIQVLIGYLLALLVLLFSAELLASAESDYEQGVKSYKEGDHQAAVIYFESARKQGIVTISLHYNLASSYYKLGKYEEAKRYFRLLNHAEEMRDIVDYHLGLIAVKEKDVDLARRYFSSIANSGEDAKLIRLSKKHLETLSKEVDAWKPSLAFNLGFDDNISSVTEDSVLEVTDSFYELYASSDLLLTGSIKNGWVTNAAFYAIDYHDINTSDANYLSLGLNRAITLGAWHTSFQLKLAKSTYGDDDFQNTARLEIAGHKLIRLNKSLRLRYAAEDINSDLALYDYLEGSRQQARIEYRDYSAQYSRKIYYELEVNDRGELSTSVDTYDYSPMRHTIRGAYTHIIEKKWWLTGDLSYRLSDFSSSSTTDREDDQWNLALSVDYYFDRTFKLSTRYQYIDNASTQDRYEYEKSIIKLGFSKIF